jgi:hypothetical protein
MNGMGISFPNIMPDAILNYPNNLRNVYSASCGQVDIGKSEMGSGIIWQWEKRKLPFGFYFRSARSLVTMLTIYGLRRPWF